MKDRIASIADSLAGILVLILGNLVGVGIFFLGVAAWKMLT